MTPAFQCLQAQRVGSSLSLGRRPIPLTPFPQSPRRAALRQVPRSRSPRQGRALPTFRFIYPKNDQTPPSSSRWNRACALHERWLVVGAQARFVRGKLEAKHQSNRKPDATSGSLPPTLKDSGLCQWLKTTPGPQGGRPTHRMEVIKKRKVTSDEMKGAATREEAAEQGFANPTISRPQPEVVSNTEERTAAPGRHHSV